MVDADGYLFILDRIKDMIVSGGENVYPTEVENAIAQCEAIGESAVIGIPDARWGEAVKAFVVLRPGHAVSEADLLAFLRTLTDGDAATCCEVKIVPVLHKPTRRDQLRINLSAGFLLGCFRHGCEVLPELALVGVLSELT